MRWLTISAAVVGAALGLGSFSDGVHAAPVVYSGSDNGSTSLVGSPNSSAAAAAFDLTTGALAMLDFETALPAGVTISGGTIGDADDVCATANLHCYATSPVNVLRNNGTTIQFSDPINAVGAYFTGWQIDGQEMLIRYANGEEAAIEMPPGNFAGGTIFFGFIDNGASITRITYVAGNPNNTDAVGIDDIRYGVVIPEPSSTILSFSAYVVLIQLRRMKFRFGV
ncbi:hypothetical protein [Bythopirellula goksoeyrii]|nr:hypothetical protein [Bythopirellula goksoeyrii]